MGKATPVDVRGSVEVRHVTVIREGDLVWNAECGRWQRVTSAFHYTTAVGGHDMVKLVFDLSTYIRCAASDDATYEVLLDAEPHPSVAPLTATQRRRQLRGRSDGDAEETAPETSRDDTATVVAPTSGRVESTGDVRVRREALRVSRGKFAEMCGLTAGALWRVEDGRPKDDELARVLRVLVEQERGK